MIRRAIHTDLPACRELFSIGKAEAPEAYEGVDIETIQHNVEDGVVLVAEEMGKVVGMVSALPQKSKTLLYMLVCSPKYRNSTLAPELIREAAKLYGKVMAITVPHAKPSFEKAGFSQTGYVMENV